MTIRNDSRGDGYLAAYVVADHANGSSATLSDALRAHLRLSLPEFMVPTQYVMLDVLPRTANGKLDRKALPDPEPVRVTAHGPVSPRTPTEAMVLEIFRDVLRRPDVDSRGNFFDFGGDSLMAARLMLRLRAACGLDVPLAMLFERQTAAELASAVDSLDAAVSSAIVPLQPLGDAPPIFGVPGHNGDVFCFRALALRLGEEQPVYGLQPPGLDGRGRPLERVEDLAAFFEDQIRKFSPSGPIVIAGNCAGCVTAFELGRRLFEGGTEIESVALFGAPFASRFHRLPRILDDTEAWISDISSRASTHVSALWSRNPGSWGAYVGEKLALVLSQRAARRASVPDPALVLRNAVERATLKAARHYRPSPFGGRLRLFVPSRAALKTRDQPLRWREFAGHTSVWYGPDGCRADTMLREPHVEGVAEAYHEQLRAG